MQNNNNSDITLTTTDSSITEPEDVVVSSKRNDDDNAADNDCGTDGCNGDGCPQFLITCLVMFGGIALIVWVVNKTAGSGTGYVRGHGGGGSRGSSRGGSTSGGSCFPAGEEILMADQTTKVAIDQLVAGSMIDQGGRVTAVMKLAANPKEDPLYRYNDAVWVTGSHLVQEDDEDEMVPVQDSDLALLAAAEMMPALVYNLISENHKLVINDTTLPIGKNGKTVRKPGPWSKRCCAA